MTTLRTTELYNHTPCHNELLAMGTATLTRDENVTGYDNMLLRYSQIVQNHQIVEDAFWKCLEPIVVEIPTQFQQKRGTVRR